MKRSGRIIILLLILAFAGANDAYGISGRLSRRRYRPVIRRNYMRTRGRSVRNLPRLYRREKNEYMLSRQERVTRRALERRFPEIVEIPRPITFVNFRLRDFPTKREIDAVIFDLDGTLLDSLWAWEESRKESVEALGFAIPDELSKQLEAMSLDEGAALIKKVYNLPESTEEILERKLAPIRAHYAQDIQAMPGIPERLARLKEQGIKMAVATASRKEFAELALTRLGLRDYFEFIISCDDVKVGKTSPKVYEVASRLLGTMKERTLVAEDALHALETAHKAGFKTAAIEEQHSIADRDEKQAVADYYIINYGKDGTLIKE